MGLALSSYTFEKEGGSKIPTGGKGNSVTLESSF